MAIRVMMNWVCLFLVNLHLVQSAPGRNKQTYDDLPSTSQSTSTAAVTLTTTIPVTTTVGTVSTVGTSTQVSGSITTHANPGIINISSSSLADGPSNTTVKSGGDYAGNSPLSAATSRTSALTTASTSRSTVGSSIFSDSTSTVQSTTTSPTVETSTRVVIIGDKSHVADKKNSSKKNQYYEANEEGGNDAELPMSQAEMTLVQKLIPILKKLEKKYLKATAEERESLIKKLHKKKIKGLDMIKNKMDVVSSQYKMDKYFLKRVCDIAEKKENDVDGLEIPKPRVKIHEERVHYYENTTKIDNNADEAKADDSLSSDNDEEEDDDATQNKKWESKAGTIQIEDLREPGYPESFLPGVPAHRLQAAWSPVSHADTLAPLPQSAYSSSLEMPYLAQGSPPMYLKEFNQMFHRYNHESVNSNNKEDSIKNTSDGNEKEENDDGDDSVQEWDNEEEDGEEDQQKFKEPNNQQGEAVDQPQAYPQEQPQFQYQQQQQYSYHFHQLPQQPKPYGVPSSYYAPAPSQWVANHYQQQQQYHSHQQQYPPPQQQQYHPQQLQQPGSSWPPYFYPQPAVPGVPALPPAYLPATHQQNYPQPYPSAVPFNPFNP